MFMVNKDMLTSHWNLPVLPSKAATTFSFIWSPWMLQYDESWCFMCRCNGMFGRYVPNKDFQFNITECTRHCCQMSVLSSALVFTFFLFFLVTNEISDFVRFHILQTYHLMMVDMFLTLFWFWFYGPHSSSSPSLRDWSNGPPVRLVC